MFVSSSHPKRVNLKIDVKTIVLLAIIVVMALLWLDSCQGERTALKDAEKYANYQDTVMYYKDKAGNAVAYNAALMIDKEQLLALNAELAQDVERLKLKNVTSYTKVTTELRIDTFVVPIHDTLPCDTFTYRTKIDSTHYKFDLTLTESSIGFNSVQIPNEQKILVGEKKNGLFKPKEYIVTLENSNPYMQVSGLQSYTLKPKKKWYQKWYVHLGVGFVGGLLLTR